MRLAVVLSTAIALATWQMASSHAALAQDQPQGERMEPREGSSPPPPSGEELRARLAHWYDLCQRGDQRACVRFGIIIGQNSERVAEWRHDHPEMFWYERDAPPPREAPRRPSGY